MSRTCSSDFVAFADRLADASGGVVARHFRTGVDVVAKSDETPVTAADREAERAMRNLIEDTYPDHGIIGEEHGGVRTGAQLVWVLDPIDGTRAFIAGKPMFGTLIALLADGVPILGVIDQPVLGERWVGAEGRPTSFNGEAVKVRPCAGLDAAILNTTSPELFDAGDADAFARLGARVAHTQFGGDCYAYGLLASGYIDLVVEAQLKPYDYCALIPVVQGAGGIMTDWQGESLTLDSDGRVIAAGDKAVHESALGALSP